MTRDKPATRLDRLNSLKMSNWLPMPINGKGPNDWVLHKGPLVMVYND